MWLNILIVLVLVGYGAYVIVSRVKQRKSGGCPGCGDSCPGGDSCSALLHQMNDKPKRPE